MEGLYKDIQKIKNKAQRQFLEVDKYYNTASLEIFQDKSRNQISSVKIVVQKFRALFEATSSEVNVKQIFKIEQALLKLDSKLEDFVDTRLQISNYHQMMHNKYKWLDLLEAKEIMKIIKNFKNKHSDIILVQREENLDVGN